MNIESKFNPKMIEEKWYNYWIKNKINHSTISKDKKSFSVVIPPPNITGALHMGHALNNTLQDTFIRFAKKHGYNTCWIPGTDHGGIATQNIVEKMLLKKNIKKNDLGRKKFLEIMWKWREETGDTILMQLKKLGCLLDWERTRFTMDKNCEEAVFFAFKKLYDEGLIYRGNRMTSFCPRCQTALSDIEVEHEMQNGFLWKIKYFFENSDNFLVVATTRPETMFGDTAVAVNPNDERYKNIIGKNLVLPIVNRKIKVIADEMVDINFGTGAVKITPSHDINDYETAKRHNLEFIKVIDDFGHIMPLKFIPEKFHLLDRFIAREEVAKELETLGYLEEKIPYKNNISVCYRCHTPIEPNISMQYFLNTKEMAKMAINVVKEKKVVFTPNSWENPFFNWMNSLHDWCISRQIWWGHRIPIWYCNECSDENNNPTIIVSREKPSECPKCHNKNNFTMEEDVLDTWFSSSLWPLSTLGFPNDEENLSYYYPTEILATGHEILYLWVARMIMMGLKFRGEVPFKKVYIHGIVRDKFGKKMSKSLGNVINPLDIIEEFGVDAIRFSLIYNGIMGRDLQVSNETFIMSRNFCNKLWNASRFVLTNLDNFLQNKNIKLLSKKDIEQNFNNFDITDKWILLELKDLKIAVKNFYQKLDFSMMSRIMYEFIWNKYCDLYIEFSKPKIYTEDENKKILTYSILVYVLDNIINLINPIIPFITEEINENINKILNLENKDLARNENFLEKDLNISDNDVKNSINSMIEVITAIRNIKKDLNISGIENSTFFISYNKNNFKLSKDLEFYIKSLTKINNIVQGENLEIPKKSKVVVTDKYQVFVLLEGLINFEEEKLKTLKKIKELNSEIEKIEKKLKNEKFLSNAPKDEIEKVKEKYNLFLEKKEKLNLNLENLV